jgi:sugar phosphate isomerase/epimerase
MVEGLRACAEHAQSVGVMLCMENLDYPPCRPLTGRGSQCVEICLEVDHPSFRLIFDCGAPPYVEEDSLETLREKAPYEAHVHIKNSRRLAPGEVAERHLDSVGGRRFTGSVLDAGVVAIEPIVAELRRMGYDGYLLIEYQGMDDPRTATKHNVPYLRGLVAKAQR